MNLRILALTAAAALALATPVLAQQSATFAGRDSTGALKTFAGQQDAASAFHYRDIMEGLTSAGAPDPVVTDGSGHPLFTLYGTPTVNLGTLGGGATSALQTTGNGTLASILAALGTPLQTGGAVTQPDQTGSITLAVGTANAAATIPLTGARGTVGTNVVGVNGTGAVLTAECENGPAAPWIACNIIAPGAIAASTITTDNNYSFDAGGHYAVRLRVSTAATAASNATVYYDATASSAIVRETNSAAVLQAAQAPSGIATAQGSATTTASVLIASRSLRRSLTFYNQSNVTIYVGPLGVSSTTGFPIPGGSSLTLTFQGALYGVTASGTAAFSDYEVF